MPENYILIPIVIPWSFSYSNVHLFPCYSCLFTDLANHKFVCMELPTTVLRSIQDVDENNPPKYMSSGQNVFSVDGRWGNIHHLGHT